MSTGKYTHFDPGPTSSHNLVLSLVAAGSRVLEFGCATGYMSEVLRTNLGCTVTGIELSPEAGELARKHCDRVIVGDAEKLEFDEVLGRERFDAILFADVLEHLRDPRAVLVRIAPFLADGGAVIASIPNIAHGSVRLALLAGEFRYLEEGLLDSTHLRFFTRESIEDLFESAGYTVTHWLRKRVEINRSEISIPAGPIPKLVREWLSSDPEATTYQFIVRAARPEANDALQQVRAERAAASAERAWMKRADTAMDEILELIPRGEDVILVDEDKWGSQRFASGRRFIPFLERDGKYWGAPSDDATATSEFERLRQSGANFLVFAWPAFWWLESFAGLHRHLRSRFPCILENDDVVVFDLRPAKPAAARGDEHGRAL